MPLVCKLAGFEMPATSCLTLSAGIFFFSKKKWENTHLKTKFYAQNIEANGGDEM